MRSKTKKISLTIRNICFISIFTAIIAVCAQISIPMPIIGVPFTLQTFAVPLAGIILGARKGSLSALIYVLLGSVGVPVFAGFRGGFAIIFGATGGFILTFPLSALCVGIFTHFAYISENKKPAVKYCLIAAGLVSGVIINYTGGMIMFAAITSRSLYEAFVLCVLPYMPLEAVKIILAGVTGVSVRKILSKNVGL